MAIGVEQGIVPINQHADRQTIQEQGYRTTAETANGAAGVLSVDAAGAPAGFSMRGFSFGEVNVLYNGISTGPQSYTSRTMDTANLSQVEAIDMGRRGLHDEGATLLADSLAGKIALDHDTARRLFTLICVLHLKPTSHGLGSHPRS